MLGTISAPQQHLSSVTTGEQVPAVGQGEGQPLCTPWEVSGEGMVGKGCGAGQEHWCGVAKVLQPQHKSHESQGLALPQHGTSWPTLLALGNSSTELLRSQQLPVKQRTVYVSASPSNTQGCSACSLKTPFHPWSPYSDWFIFPC